MSAVEETAPRMTQDEQKMAKSLGHAPETLPWITARPQAHVRLPQEFKCRTCRSFGRPCSVYKSPQYPKGRAEDSCACCPFQQTPCSFITSDKPSIEKRQKWLDSNVELAPSDPTQHGTSAPQAEMQQSDSASGSPHSTSSISQSQPRRIRLVTKPPLTPPAPASSSSSVTTPPAGSRSIQQPPPSAREGSEEEQSGSKRPRPEVALLPDDGMESPPPSKTARIEILVTSASSPATDPMDYREQGEDPEFGRHILGLLLRHDTAIKTRQATMSANTELMKEVDEMKRQLEEMRLQKAKVDSKNSDLLDERQTAAVLLEELKEKATQLSLVKEQCDKAEKSLMSSQAARVLEQKLAKDLMDDEMQKYKQQVEKERDFAIETEREKAKKAVEAEREKGRLRTGGVIKHLEARAKDVEGLQVQLDQAVSNADASRLARNEAQSALEVAQMNEKRLIDQLQDKTDAFDTAVIELEAIQKEVKELRVKCDAQLEVKTELATLRTDHQQLATDNARLAGIQEELAELKEKSGIVQHLADDRLQERLEMGEELRKVKAECGKLGEKAVKMEVQAKESEIKARTSNIKAEEIKRNWNIAKTELLAVHRKNRNLKADLQQYQGGEAGSSTVKRESSQQ